MAAGPTRAAAMAAGPTRAAAMAAGPTRAAAMATGPTRAAAMAAGPTRAGERRPVHPGPALAGVCPGPALAALAPGGWWAAAFERPEALALGLAAAAALLWLEQRRRRPVTLVVADLALAAAAAPDPSAARRARRRADLGVWLRVAAALALAAAAAGPRGGHPAGRTVDLVLDRGVTTAALEPDGRPRRAHLVDALEPALAALGPGDRARVHLVPGPPTTTALDVAAARALLRAAPSLAAAADLEAAVGPLAARAAAEGAPAVVVATDRALGPGAGPATQVVVRAAGAPRRNRGVVGLAEDDAGRLWVTVAGAPGPATVELELVGPGDATRRARLEVDIRPEGHAGQAGAAPAGAAPAGEGIGRAALATSGEAPEAPAAPAGGATAPATPEAPAAAPRGGPDVATARLVHAPGAPDGEGPDALALDDQAVAVRALPRRRVGVVGRPGAAVLRALAAVPGTTLLDLGPGGAPARVAELDLVVLPELPLVLPRTAVVVVPPFGATPGPPPPGAVAPRAGGRLAGRAHPAFPWTLAEVARGGVVVGAPAALPEGAGDVAALLDVVPSTSAVPEDARGGPARAPLVALRGRGRDLLALVLAPVDGGPAASWALDASFPLFWAELLALAAEGPGPRAGRLAAVEAGRDGAPWTVGLHDLPSGRVGTRAARARLAAPAPPPAAFDPDAWLAGATRRPAGDPAGPSRWLLALAAAAGAGAVTAWAAAGRPRDIVPPGRAGPSRTLDGHGAPG